MSDTTDHMPDDELLAAEFVLGLLSQSEWRAAERRAESDVAFATLVADWQTRLMPWADEIAAVEPPDAVWQRIEATLPAHPLRRASDRAPAQAVSWWNGLAFWRGLAFGAGGLAIASIAALFIVLSKPAQAPLVATIEAGGRSAVVATIDPRRGTILVVPATLSVPQGRVPELWLIPPGEKPRSLGVITTDRAVTITIPANLLPQTTAQAVLAISDEPPGGSPTGAPTGQVIGTGKLTNL